MLNNEGRIAQEMKQWPFATLIVLSKVFDCLQYNQLFKKLERLGFNKKLSNGLKVTFQCETKSFLKRMSSSQTETKYHGEEDLRKTPQNNSKFSQLKFIIIMRTTRNRQLTNDKLCH